MRVFRTLLAASVVAGVSLPAWAVDPAPLLKTLQAVGPNGAGNRDATAAWQTLATAEASQLPVILAGLDAAGPLAANWIRTAVDTIAERQLQAGGSLPADALEQFVLDRSHDPRGRRLAYEWLRRVDPTAPDRLIPGMLDDPSLELRREAVAQRIDRAEALADAEKMEAAMPVYETAMAAARDIDQITLLADRLKKLGRPVDLPRHFGFLMTWKVVGPFDNLGEKGFDRVFPPEQTLDTTASYQGKHGEVRWVDHVTTEPYGTVDLNKVLGEEKGVVAYATTDFLSARRQEVQFRTTSLSAVKLWLNGRLIDRHDIYHGGSSLDQYVCTGVLQPGRNVILIKVCQNEQTQSWANVWSFQLRVCDHAGTAVLSGDRKEPDRKEPDRKEPDRKELTAPDSLLLESNR